ncbi:isochorismatase family protein [Frankia sp. AgPm24]|uniref:isochorismatase family protein n=1 Tax=Frankia sp. AgPm24 TaxID=631128 RepID=UPI00200CFB3C|nr:isochorismatase family protein [Frankia sp. AgPm24]MCK9920728.1 isochorismatase family protein [Frankia sp. AgPm24]
MGLPAVSAYPMPTEPELPASRVDWTPQPARCALLIHDMQEHFLRIYPAGQSPTRELLANIVRLRAAANALDVPVIYTAQPPDVPPARRGLLWDFWGPGLRAGNESVVADLTPAPGDRVLAKHRYSAFHRTGLADLLADAGRDQLVICGVYAHIGINASACEAFMGDIAPFLVADAIADFSRDAHDAALRTAASQFAVPLTVERLLVAWSHAQAEEAVPARSRLP